MDKIQQQKAPISPEAKQEQLEGFYARNAGEKLTTNQGVRVSHTDDSLKAGERGPTLMEDFHFREKMTHFDHERIPERVVHARGFGAHGYFQVYESMAEYTKAGFLQDPSQKTPVFVRFSTVVGSRGSADTVRDVRGFATKFYTQDGNYDLVANNIPIFFIQDGIKFPDIVHAIKPEPDNEIPQASAAHDTFWDFVVNTPELAHMIMWLMSDRAIPRSFRMMEGFGEPLDIHKLVSGKKERQDRIQHLLNQVGLNPDHINRYPHEFSGGQRQRVGIARALAVEPKFIVCDEPISAVDVSIQAQIVNKLEELQAELNLTFLFIAHDLSMVKYISDRVAVMYLGKIMELNKSANLYAHPVHPYTKALLSAVPIADPPLERRRQRIILEGDVPSPINPPSGCCFHTRCNRAIPICSQETPEMKDLGGGHLVACHNHE